MDNKKISLGGKWELFIVPHDEVTATGFDPTTKEALDASAYTPIEGSVPGNFEPDMYRAGLIGDPFWSDNILKMQELEDRHLWYACRFDVDGSDLSDRYLDFEGIDTVADVYLNGEKIGHCENMLVPQSFPAVGLKTGCNSLVVHIFPAMIYARRYELTPACGAFRYNFASLPLRKAPAMYGWDIMPRAVSGGIWKDVFLTKRPKERIESAYLYTNFINGDSATLNLFFSIDTPCGVIRDMKITVDGVCGDSSFHMEEEVWHTYGTFWGDFRGHKLWWPKNAGAQNLYDVTVRLMRGDEVIDDKKFRFGVRTVKLVRTSTETENGDFHFEINGKPIFCLGTNWVPLDAFHSNDVNRLEKALELTDGIGCNMVRCWGGNVYESDRFFEFCDEHGIMVWQDFAMGCATYPSDARMQEMIYEEAVEVIRRLRNHASLVLWAGDNECDIAANWIIRGPDPNDNVLTRKSLSEAVRLHDAKRPYIPSSPYIDENVIKTGGAPTEDHLWGPRDYFKGDYYGTTVCHFASECGYHACNSPESLKKFIAPDRLWPNMKDGVPNRDWLLHSTAIEDRMDAPFTYRIGLMTSQVRTMFGTVPDDLDTYARMSQISQAEADKYFIERFRISKWRRTGIIWWNIVDGWPQVSDAVVDYYFVKKLAYEYIRRSQSPILFAFDEPKNGVLTLCAVNDTPETVDMPYSVKDITTGSTVCTGIAHMPADSAVAVTDIPAPDGEHFLYIEWENGSNHFMTKTRDIDYAAYMTAIKKVGYDTFEGF